ncbi:MAG: TMEM165/GDT1 family protein [Mycobacteriales bacterium]
MTGLAAAGVTFGLVAVAELPDKTFLAALVLGARFRPLPAWLGVAAAFTVHVALAVSAGSVVTLLPARARDAVVAGLFAAGAGYLILRRNPAPGEDAKQAEVSQRTGRARTPAQMALAAFVVVFLAEWGDLTQVLTIDLAARYRDPGAVAGGAVAALWLVGALGVFAGNRLLTRLPARALRIGMGIALAAFAVAAAVQAATA